MKRSTMILLLGMALVGGIAAAFGLQLRGRPARPKSAIENTVEVSVAPEPAISVVRTFDTSANAVAPLASAAVAPPPQQSAEDAARQWAEQQRAREAQVAAEPVDRNWSREATASFRKDFETLGARDRFQVTDLECKTTSCLAKLSWGSYGDARKTWHDVLHGRYEKGCARQVFVPPPDQGQSDSSYEGTVYFDCTQDRAK